MLRWLLGSEWSFPFFTWNWVAVYNVLICRSLSHFRNLLRSIPVIFIRGQRLNRVQICHHQLMLRGYIRLILNQSVFEFKAVSQMIIPYRGDLLILYQAMTLVHLWELVEVIGKPFRNMLALATTIALARTLVVTAIVGNSSWVMRLVRVRLEVTQAGRLQGWTCVAWDLKGFLFGAWALLGSGERAMLPNQVLLR